MSQLANLERRTGRGKDVIDHPRGSKNDIANAIAGLAWYAGDGNQGRSMNWGIIQGFGGGHIKWNGQEQEEVHPLKRGLDRPKRPSRSTFLR